MKEKRVVITGIGPVSKNGIGKDAFFKSIYDHTMYVEPIPEKYKINYDFKTKFYVPAPVINFSDYGIPDIYKSILQNDHKMIITATKLALDDAGFELLREKKKFISPELEDASVIIGTTMTSHESCYDSYIAHLAPRNEELLSIYNSYKKIIRYNRFNVPASMLNSISAVISILFSAKGDNFTMNTACASGTYALGEAFRRIKFGLNSIVISGGVESMQNDFGTDLRGFDILDTLTKSPTGEPMPFSKNRSGFLFSDGAACILILEDLEHALARKSTIYAEIVNYSANSDAHNLVQIDESGIQIKKLIHQLIKNEKIDYINSHGTATVLNDKVEAKVLQEIFGDKKTQPWINSTKGIIGHSLGASGALEAAVCAYSIQNATLHGNNIINPMDNLNILRETISTPVNMALSLSYGFGGHNAGLLFKKITI